jgi:hypothetical protein
MSIVDLRVQRKILGAKELAAARCVMEPLPLQRFNRAARNTAKTESAEFDVAKM